MNTCIKFTSLLILGVFLIPSSRADDGAAPTAVLQISQEVLTTMVRREVNETTPVVDCFQGTRLLGSALTHGHPLVAVKDHDEFARLDLEFVGVTTTRTRGYHSPVVVQGGSRTSFKAAKELQFKLGHGVHGSDVTIESQTTTFVDNISLQRPLPFERLILRRAWSEVNASKPASVAFAKSRAETRIVKEFDAVVERQLAELRRRAQLRYIAEDVFQIKLMPVNQCLSRNGCLQLAVFNDAGRISTKYELPRNDTDNKFIRLYLHKDAFAKPINRAATLLTNFLDAREDGVARLLAHPLLATSTGLRETLVSTLNENDQIAWRFSKDWLVISFSSEALQSKGSVETSLSSANSVNRR